MQVRVASTGVLYEWNCFKDLWISIEIIYKVVWFVEQDKGNTGDHAGDHGDVDLRPAK